MLDNKCIEYKYSIFGDFSLIQSRLRELSNLLDKDYVFSTVGNEVVGQNIFPIFSFVGKDDRIVIGRTRIDLVIVNRNNESAAAKDLIGKIIEFLPKRLDRFAINLAYRIVGFDDVLKKKLASSTFLSPIGKEVSEFAVRQNFPTMIGRFKGNNIITIQTGFFFDNSDFTTKQAISVSIDVNTVPFVKVGEDKTMFISADEINSLIDYISIIAMSDKKRIFEQLK